MISRREKTLDEAARQIGSNVQSSVAEARVVVFLASNEATYVTGAKLFVDGGEADV